MLELGGQTPAKDKMLAIALSVLHAFGMFESKRIEPEPGFVLDTVADNEDTKFEI